MTSITNEEYLALINQEPTEVRRAEDGDYDFQPISHIKNELDVVFGGDWSFDLDRETVGRGEAIAKGTLTYRHLSSGAYAWRSGTAAIVLGKGLRMDYPKLEAAVLVNAAKKIGKRFGRDLNKDREDLPVITPEAEEEPDKEYLETVALIKAADFREDAEDVLRRSGFRFHAALKEFVATKPPKTPQ